MGVWIWLWNQRPIIPIEASSQDRKKHVNFSQMWKFCSLVSSIAMACCIMNSCHKVNKVYYLEVMRWLHEAIPQKRTELWKNQSWILHHYNIPAHTSMLVRENVNSASTTIFTGLGPCLFFPLPKVEDTDTRKAFCCDWGNKRKIETGAVGDTKKRVSGGLEGGYFEREKIVIDK